MSKKEITGEQIREVLMNSSNSLIPGATFLQDILNYRQNLKQKRIIHFLDSFINGLGDIQGKSNEEVLETCKTEEFVDVFDSIITKVHHTSSEQKARRFSSLLKNQVIDPLPDYYILKVVDILDRLNDIQMVMILKLKDHPYGIKKSNSLFTFMGKEVDQDYNTVLVEISSNNTVRVSKSDLELYLRDLTSQGLVNLKSKSVLKRPGKHRVNERSSLKTMEIIELSKSGKSFLEILSTESF
jgi:effector-binding domain-containing protein